MCAAAGVFLLQAAIRFDPHRAKGLDETLRTLARTLRARGCWSWWPRG
ncbi:hypothetical protein ACFQZC_03155 [Streptacidiphilus monticola]